MTLRLLKERMTSFSGDSKTDSGDPKKSCERRSRVCKCTKVNLAAISKPDFERTMARILTDTPTNWKFTSGPVLFFA